jgi:hypothetical protein
MAIEELLRVATPPANPVEPGDAARWEDVQRALGIPLPPDYRDFGTLYGTGHFPEMGNLTIANPFAVGFLPGVQADCASLRGIRGLKTGRNVPYGVFPDQPGWFPLGGDSHGFTLYWVTEGQPTDWPILLAKLHRGAFQQIKMSLTSFLARLAQGQLETLFDAGLEEETEPVAVHFVPSRPFSGTVEDSPQLAQRGGRPRIEWFPPDEFGRPTGASVLLEPHFPQMVYEGFTAYPPWWFELPASSEPWVRQHLVGWRLGGPGHAALHNMIPVRWGAHLAFPSIEGVVECQVRQGQSVVYQVTPIYEGNNRYAKQIICSAEPLPNTGSTWSLCPTPIWNSPPDDE